MVDSASVLLISVSLIIILLTFLFCQLFLIRTVLFILLFVCVQERKSNREYEDNSQFFIASLSEWKYIKSSIHYLYLRKSSIYLLYFRANLYSKTYQHK